MLLVWAESIKTDIWGVMRVGTKCGGHSTGTVRDFEGRGHHHNF